MKQTKKNENIDIKGEECNKTEKKMMMKRRTLAQTSKTPTETNTLYSEKYIKKKWNVPLLLQDLRNPINNQNMRIISVNQKKYGIHLTLKPQTRINRTE